MMAADGLWCRCRWRVGALGVHQRRPLPACGAAEVAMMRPLPEATPPGGSGSVGEYFFLLPTGGVSFLVKRGMHAKHLLEPKFLDWHLSTSGHW